MKSPLVLGILMLSGILFSLFSAQKSISIPSPLISRGKTVVISGGGNAAHLVDGVFGGASFTVSNNSWLAVHVGSGASKLFFTWNNPAYSWSDDIGAAMSCKQQIQCPVDYVIETSEDSDNGSNGEWETVVTVTDNVVTARGHELMFDGKSWVRMTIVHGGGTIDEVEIYDASDGLEDTWFFAGTSISAGAFKSFTTNKTFTTLINEAHDAFNPAIIRGGIPCILTTQFADDISKYLEVAGNCRYWAIEMGTNDGYNNGNSNVAMFKLNLQKVIDSCKAHNIEPVIARVLATNQAKAGWQIHDDYVTAVDELTADNNLVPGPDFNKAAKDNPSYLGDNDGIHLSSEGSAAMYRLWAEKMDELYTTVTAKRSLQTQEVVKKSSFSINAHRTILSVTIKNPGILLIFAINGRLMKSIPAPKPGTYRISRTKGCVVLMFSGNLGSETALVPGN